MEENRRRVCNRNGEDEESDEEKREGRGRNVIVNQGSMDG